MFFSFLLEGCIYKNITYQEGEKWIDGCTYFCECTNGKRGMYTCNERYVPYDFVNSIFEIGKLTHIMFLSFSVK